MEENCCRKSAVEGELKTLGFQEFIGSFKCLRDVLDEELCHQVAGR